MLFDYSRPVPQWPEVTAVTLLANCYPANLWGKLFNGYHGNYKYCMQSFKTLLNEICTLFVMALN